MAAATGPAMVTHPELGHVLAMDVVYNGDPAAGEKEIAPLRAIGKPLVDGIMMQDYKVMQTQEDATVAHGIRSYAKNAMIGEFSQALVDDLNELIRALGVRPEDRVYRPHITVARNARQFTTERLMHRQTTEWSEFELIESLPGRGSTRYVPLKQ